MARTIRVQYSYTGPDTEWNYIKRGDYEESDAALYGLADKLIERRIAIVYEGTKEVKAVKPVKVGAIEIKSGGDQ
jgi:hypothetical protein